LGQLDLKKAASRGKGASASKSTAGKKAVTKKAKKAARRR